MKYKTLIAGLVFSCVIAGAFADDQEDKPVKNAITIGILQGGGGLIGLDYERLLAGGWGIQIGAGYVSAGVGLTYHLGEETTNSNALWLGIWNQGIPGADNSTTYVGASCIVRGWGWLNGQLGFAYIPFRGQQAINALKSLTHSNQDPPPFALLYSLGWYKGF